MYFTPPPGWLFDWTGSYDISFIAMGAMIALSGLMLFFLPPIQRWHQRRSTAAGLQHDADLGRHILHEKKAIKDVDIGLVEVDAWSFVEGWMNMCVCVCVFLGEMKRNHNEGGLGLVVKDAERARMVVIVVKCIIFQNTIIQ